MNDPDFPSTHAMSRFLDCVVERRADARDRTIATGHRELDETLAGGLRAGTVSLVAGIPGVGTSMFALGIARRAALIDGLRTVVIAPDATGNEIFARILAAESKIPINHLRSGGITSDDVARAQLNRAPLVAAQLRVSADWHRPATSEAVVASVDEWVARCGAQFVVVDGTHQAEPAARDLIRALKLIALRHRATILVASKMVLSHERRADWPVVEDLREYHSTADVFDLILGLHRPDMHDPESTRPGEADVEILKHRFGPTRRFTVAFQGHYARFVDLA